MASYAYVSNDNDVVLTGFSKDSDGSYINTDTTLTFTVTDSTGANVTGAVGLAMVYETGSNGNYRGTIPSTVVLVDRAAYKAVISSSTYGFQVEIDFIAQVRRA